MREHSQLNVKGSSIVPPSDVSTNDVMVSARSAAAAGLPRDAHFSDMSLTWGLSLFLLSDFMMKFIINPFLKFVSVGNGIANTF